tara:strand:+ start:75 stop:281 length:207 start_codon:yes stop_codon:yes gene_type:complete
VKNLSSTNHEKLIFWNPIISKLIIINSPITKKGVKINGELGFPKKLILSAPTKAKRKIVVKLIYCFKF